MLAYPLEASRLPNLMVEGRSHGGARPAPLETFRFSLNRGTSLVFCFIVLLIGKPLPTFPEALYLAPFRSGRRARQGAGRGPPRERRRSRHATHATYSPHTASTYSHSVLRHADIRTPYAYATPPRPMKEAGDRVASRSEIRKDFRARAARFIRSNTPASVSLGDPGGYATSRGRRVRNCNAPVRRTGLRNAPVRKTSRRKTGTGLRNATAPIRN